MKNRPKPPPSSAGRRGPAPYIFLAPYVLLTAVFFVVPLLNAAVLAFHETNGPRSRIFVGFANFQYLFTDPMFHTALKNTTVFAVAAVLIQLPLSLGLAMLLNSGSDRVKGWLRLILFSPNLVGQIFVGILFTMFFMPRYGLINRTVHALIGWGLEEQWIRNPSLCMPALIITSLWLWVGFNMVYFLAGLQAVDKDLEEAARIDGAGPWRVFWHITLPSMRHVVLFVVVTSVIGSYQLFELPLAMWHGNNGFGPNNAGLTLITYLNEVAFKNGDLGLGSAVGWIVAVIVFVLSLVQIRISRLVSD